MVTAGNDPKTIHVTGLTRCNSSACFVGKCNALCGCHHYVSQLHLSPTMKIYHRHQYMRSSSVSHSDYQLALITVNNACPLCLCILGISVVLVIL